MIFRQLVAWDQMSSSLAILKKRVDVAVYDTIKWNRKYSDAYQV
jgi:hypothetical protein